MKLASVKVDIWYKHTALPVWTQMYSFFTIDAMERFLFFVALIWFFLALENVVTQAYNGVTRMIKAFDLTFSKYRSTSSIYVPQLYSSTIQTTVIWQVVQYINVCTEKVTNIFYFSALRNFELLSSQLGFFLCSSWTMPLNYHPVSTLWWHSELCFGCAKLLYWFS